MMHSNTDWDTVTVLRKKPPKASEAKTDRVVRQAQQRGLPVETSKKFNAATNKQHMMTKNATKLDQETEAQRIDTVGIDVGRAIQQGRQAKKMTQADLAKQVNEKQTVINDFESGRAVTNQQILAKLENALGVKLRGKDIGAPIVKPGAKSKKISS